MSVTLNPDKMKVYSHADRNKRVIQAPPIKSDDRNEGLKERKRLLLSEIINYEKQNFDDWPDGREFLEATRREMYKADDELDRSLKKK